MWVVIAGWDGQRKDSVLCDIRVSAKMKGNVYKTVLIPAMMLGFETVPLRKKLKARLEVRD